MIGVYNVGILVTVLCILLVGMLITSYFVQGALTDKEKVSLLDMGQSQFKRNAIVLWVLAVVSIAYGALLRHLHTLTGITMLDGGFGVALGLYICAHPAANAVNMLFFERHVLRQISSDWATIRWLTLNLLVLLAGWVAIYIGITRLVARAA